MGFCEQVDDLLVVDLNEGGAHFHAALLASLLHLTEDVVDSSGDDSDAGQVCEVGGRSTHGECLAA